MFLHIDPAGDLPIYEQIVRQVKFAIAAGALAPDDMVASVRELAREVAVNPNTVIRAYRQLQDEAILLARRGTGLVVAPGAPELCRAQRLAMIRARLAAVLAEARQSGLHNGQVEQLVRDELAATLADAHNTNNTIQSEEISS